MPQGSSQLTKAHTPESRVFVDPWTMISEQAVGIYANLCEKADTRDPDIRSVYIYNNWEKAYVLLEALIIFQDGPGIVWPMCKDGDHTEQTPTVPAPYSKIPSQTLPLTPPFPQNHPSTFGKRFFEHKTADEDSHKQMVDEWFSGLEPDVKQRMENQIQER
ncbi:hypothetical protein EV368DRAFT_64235 [Lentinula lateritia]|nr:hypothetical protein EV368DRAFT_64235 [Lentinula lateritia]